MGKARRGRRPAYLKDPPDLPGEIEKFQEGSMLAALDLAKRRMHEPSFDLDRELVSPNLDEFTSDPVRYCKRRNVNITIKAGKQKIVGITGNTFRMIQHCDLFLATSNVDQSEMVVESDETTTIIILKHYDLNKTIGREMRLRGRRPINTLLDTLKEDLSSYQDEENEEEAKNAGDSVDDG